jgi:DNA-directed RNA polymerase specialized sigma24 family protein
MPGEDDPKSVSAWIVDLKAGSRDAIRPLMERYFEQLIRLARDKLRQSRPAGAVEDEEDAALSAFDSFCDGAVNGQFPQLTDREDLWRLLVVITARKAIDQAKRQGRQRRGGGRVIAPGDLDQFVGGEPSPEFAAMVGDEFRRLLAALSETERRVALWKMEGYTRKEIGDRLNVSERTVATHLRSIRGAWKGAGAG